MEEKETTKTGYPPKTEPPHTNTLSDAGNIQLLYREKTTDTKRNGQNASSDLPRTEPASTNLVSDALFVKDDWRLLFVGFDAADVVWFFGGQIFYQCNHGVFEESSSCQGTLCCLEV